VGLKRVVVARIPTAGVELFRRYEELVLVLLLEHGATLERRLVSRGGEIELHILDFPSQTALDSYLSDQRRLAHEGLLISSGAQTELLELDDLAV
jgi:hypothetical protein